MSSALSNGNSHDDHHAEEGIDMTPLRFHHDDDTPNVATATNHADNTPPPPYSAISNNNSNGNNNNNNNNNNGTNTANPSIPIVRRPSDSLRRSLPIQVNFEDVLFSVKMKAALARSTGGAGVDGATLKQAKENDLVDKVILNKLSGVFKPGRLTAIMGPSGSGKTTLLNAIAGYLHLPPSATYSGSVRLNSLSLPLSDRSTQLYVRSLSAFVHQHDVILDTMTVREAIQMSATLRLPKSMTDREKKERVDEVIDILDLWKCENNFIGSVHLKGISGGERRRVSIGMELITNPSILFLDEPSTGLDTFTAYSVVNTLKTLAAQHDRTVIATIHQPSSDIFYLFDDLIILADGGVMYAGPAQHALTYFSRLGFVCPKFSNPADFFFMDILYTHKKGDDSLASSDLQGITEEKKPLVKVDSMHDHDNNHASNKLVVKEDDLAKRARLLSAWPQSSEAIDVHTALANPPSSPLPHMPDEAAKLDRPGFGTQFQLLAKRALLNFIRNKLTLKAQLGQSIFLGLLVGLIYLQLPNDQVSIQDRSGSLFFLCVTGLFGASMGTLNVFGAEKIVFQHEYASGMYGIASYFFSRILVEFPFRVLMPVVLSTIAYWMIGYQTIFVNFVRFCVSLSLLSGAGFSIGVATASIVPDINVALQILPPIFLPLMIFSGFFLNQSNSPAYLGWITYISPVKYTFVSLAKNEYYGLKFYCNDNQFIIRNNSRLCPVTSGEQVIANFDFDEELTIGENQYVLIGFMVILAAMALAALYRTSKKI